LSGDPATIRMTRRFSAPPERVFDAWLDAGVAARWLFATATRPLLRADIDARCGGRCRFVEQQRDSVAEHTGRYVEIEPHRRLAFTLTTAADPQVVTCVCVDIAPRRHGCTLTLTHEGVPWQRATATSERWIGMLHGLRLTLDSAAAS